MELFQTDDHYIVQDGQHSLWCSRSDGKLIPQHGKLSCLSTCQVSASCELCFVKAVASAYPQYYRHSNLVLALSI